ncbi:uncharacterized protein CANTADRAFT_88710 [Suhomyces tanzawaensis NRRL Y-17324]|uniref:Zn(2)-C6 fungal-type domain-containing protein n=1 Tax=Suhomyces tanzawaensis NRRL Y-17324 TaxID=984487 RepID=A0A1E4SMQ4_9ASCO|nr:uncharacterized protein CANTADRAFT_88710 [Suhomyces tanzawaensis NRRL Y-17324]ODV80801.1 hypothetical protein CANTADRAFT_88710 [Suhomyces tanzawaensis NRRL Y-17324]
MDSQSLDTLETKQVTQQRTFVVLEPVKTKNILAGPLKRSRNGCEPCRRRKKKCDEQQPVCGLCQYRNVECTFRDNPKVTIKKHQFKPETAQSPSKVPEVQTAEAVPSTEDFTQQALILPSSLVEFKSSLQLPYNVEIENTYSHIPTVYDEYFSLTPPRLPLSPLTLDLDDFGPIFLQGFIAKVSKTICIATDASNYYCKTIVQIAATDKSVLYAIAAWGGLFIEGFTPTVQAYMTRAIELSDKTQLVPGNLGKKELYVMFSFCIVMMGFHISAGDVRQWNVLLGKCVKLISELGGLRKMCELYEYSNDIKFLCSALLFHDLMSSAAFIKGTALPMGSYLEIFRDKKLLEMGNYGLDPLQGCIQPLYLLMGEISTVAAELRVKKKVIAEKYDQLANKKLAGVYESSRQEYELKLARIEYFEDATEQFNILQRKLQNCLPSAVQMELIMHDEKELELHLTLFDIYMYTSQLCLNSQIKEMTPESFEIQKILVNALNCIDVLIDTKMVASLSLALLVCGVACSTDCDRREMEQRIERVRKVYPVENVVRIVDVIHQVWAVNDHGKVCVDWAEICRKKGWELAVC